MNSKTQRSSKQKSVENSKLLHQKCEMSIPQHADRKQETLKVPAVSQNADGKRGTFEFKVPAIPQCVQRNVIPTGKQIPRTPVKPITKPEEGSFNPELCYIPSSKRDDFLIVGAKVKSFIPKGREIPRTPSPCYKLSSRSCKHHSQLLPEVSLGALLPGETDEIKRFNEGILSGKINMRKKTLKTKSKVDGNISNASERDDQGTSENSSHLSSLNLKSSGEVHTCQKSLENLAKEENCKSVLKDISNGKKGIRRNPERKGRKIVNYKL